MNNQCAKLIGLAMVLMICLPTRRAWCDPTSAPSTLPSTAPVADVTLTVTIEDNQRQLHAVVVCGGKPVENATVVFTAHRLFGELLLGQDKTLDDGSAAINFPSGLPAGTTGELDVTATVQAPPAIAGTCAKAHVTGGKIVQPTSDYQSPSLWTRHSSWVLRAIVLGLVALAWGTYLIAIRQLLLLRKGA